MTDRPTGDIPHTPEELEREIRSLEQRLDTIRRNDTGSLDHRFRRLSRQIKETTPDALFSPGGDTGLRGMARRTDSYGFVLVTLSVLVWIFVPLASQERWAALPTVIVFYLTVIISMHTSYVRERWLILVVAIDSVLLLVTVTGVIVDSNDLRAIGNAGFALLLMATALVILRRILRHHTVTSRTLSGAVAAYLFIGLAFACAAEAIVMWDAEAYTSGTGSPFDFASMLYFSFVTLATLGYGDIVPVDSTARPLATAEAILGQIYLVTIVARLVSLLGINRFARREAGDEPDTQSQ